MLFCESEPINERRTGQKTFLLTLEVAGWYYIRALLSGASWGGTGKAARADLENDTGRAEATSLNELNLDDCEEQEIKEGLNTRV